MFRRSVRLWSLLALPVAAIVGACSEDLSTGEACPLLCPGQEIQIIDTVIEPAYVFDTTLVGYPLQGLESPLLLAARLDTLDVRAVIRFDTLQRYFFPPGGDTLEPVTMVDSVFLSFRMWNGGVPTPDSFLVDVYDVFDSTLADTARGEVLNLFRLDRLLATYVVDTSFVDSSRVRIPLDTAYMRAVVTDPTRRLHIGLRVRPTSPVQMRIAPYVPGGDGATLEYRVSPDSSVAKVAGLQPFSNTPRNPQFVAGDYVDFSVVALAPDVTAPERFSVGGLPAARAYLRFDLPLWLTDSVGVLRARLELTQDPVRGAGDSDTIQLLTHLVLAGNSVTDLTRAATLLSPSATFAANLSLVPSDSGVQLLEMNSLVRQWASLGGERPLPSAIVFRTDFEGATPSALRFFGVGATDPSLRPRLRVSYTPSKVFGRP